MGVDLAAELLDLNILAQQLRLVEVLVLALDLQGQPVDGGEQGEKLPLDALDLGTAAGRQGGGLPFQHAALLPQAGNVLSEPVQGLDDGPVEIPAAGERHRHQHQQDGEGIEIDAPQRRPGGGGIRDAVERTADTVHFYRLDHIALALEGGSALSAGAVAEDGLPQALLEFRGDGAAVEKNCIAPLIRQDEVQSLLLALGQLGGEAGDPEGDVDVSHAAPVGEVSEAKGQLVRLGNGNGGGLGGDEGGVMGAGHPAVQLAQLLGQKDRGGGEQAGA